MLRFSAKALGAPLEQQPVVLVHAGLSVDPSEMDMFLALVVIRGDF